jgi:hypothetical protein
MTVSIAAGERRGRSGLKGIRRPVRSAARSRMARACCGRLLEHPGEQRRLFGSCISARTSGSFSVAISSGLWPSGAERVGHLGRDALRGEERLRGLAELLERVLGDLGARVVGRRRDRRCSASSISAARRLRMAPTSSSTWSRLASSWLCSLTSIALFTPWSW